MQRPFCGRATVRFPRGRKVPRDWVDGRRFGPLSAGVSEDAPSRMKQTRRAFLKSTTLLAAAAPLMRLGLSDGKAAPGPAARRPLITGSFLDIQHVNNWDAQYWIDECREWQDENSSALVAEMKAVGLDTVILTNCALWGRPLYPANRQTVGLSWPLPCADPVGAIVRACEMHGLGIFLGLGAFGRYSLNANPDLSPEHDVWLANMAEDLRDKYGHSPDRVLHREPRQ